MTQTQPLKLTIIGGGSSYTPDIAEMLIARKDDFAPTQLTLMDIDPDRLKTVGNFTKNLLQDSDLDLSVNLTTDLQEAVNEANFVLVCIRVGGSQARVYDESIPFKHGLIGQETHPPGGMVMAMRQIPEMIKIAKAMEEFAAPNAWLLSLANPAGILTEALHRHSHTNVAGLCNGPTVMREGLLKVLQPSGNDLFIKTAGLNHLHWSKVYLQGEEVTRSAYFKLDAWIKKHVPTLESFPPEIVDFIGMIPSGHYARFYYLLPESFEDLADFQKKIPTLKNAINQINPDFLDDKDLHQLETRADWVRLMEQKTMALYAENDREGFDVMRVTRGGRGYGEAALSLASAIWNNKNELHVIDVKNQGAIQGMDNDVVVETTCLVNKSGVYPLMMDTLPLHTLAFLQAVKKYEVLTVKAAVEGNYHAALEALVANPLVTSFNQAKAALDELLIAHKQYLPKFSKVVDCLEHDENPLLMEKSFRKFG